MLLSMLIWIIKNKMNITYVFYGPPLEYRFGSL
jgi:hypothetical protein